MVLDINLFRPEKGGNIEKIKESEKNRYHDVENVDKVVEFDEKWRKCIFKLEELKKELNKTQKEIGLKLKADKNADIEDLKKKSLTIKEDIPIIQNEEKYLLKQRNFYLEKIGNILNKDVVISDDEANNKVVKTWGICKKIMCNQNGNDKKYVNETKANKINYYHHFDLLLKIGGGNYKKGISVAGHRGYYLTGMGFMLYNALLQYALNFLIQKKYEPVYPPFFMRRNVMEQCAELADFDETLYKIHSNVNESCILGNSNENLKTNSIENLNENIKRDELYLIATSEQPLCALNKDEVIESKKLPIKYVGVSSCFRKEAGAHGKDIRGIFRVHQFDKIEQFCITLPHLSNKMHKEMLNNCEEFYQSLNIPYRIVSIVSGALNNAAAIKYDLEAYFPSLDQYKELVSCSNCTNYQSINLNIKYVDSSFKNANLDENYDSDYEQFKKDFQTDEKNYVHLLNGTMLAAQRCLCCILENYQNGEGIVVPDKLRPYMNNIDFIPFIE